MDEQKLTAEQENVKVQAERLGLNFDDIKRGYQRISPIIKPIVRLTPNKFDDAFVMFLDAIFAAPANGQ